MLAAGCENVNGFRCAIAFASYALAMRSPRARRVQISSLLGARSKRRRSALCWTVTCWSAAQRSTEEEFGSVTAKTRTTRRHRASANLRLLAVCKTLAIRSRRRRGEVRIRAYCEKGRGNFRAVPIRLRQKSAVSPARRDRRRPARQKRHRRDDIKTT